MTRHTAPKNPCIVATYVKALAAEERELTEADQDVVRLQALRQAVEDRKVQIEEAIRALNQLLVQPNNF